METLASGAALISFSGSEEPARSIARGQNFLVEWVRKPGQPITIESSAETIVLLASGAAAIQGPAGTTQIAASSIAIIPAGRTSIQLIEGGPLIVLATDRKDLAADAVEGRDARDPRIAPIDAPFQRRENLPAPLVQTFDSLPNPSGNPRIRFVQSATMSINIVRYEGERDSSALSPHAHGDIEQGTLAIYGDYVHHLRTPWGKNMADWREDEHIAAGPGTLLLIPPELVHTTQGIGGDRHLLVDIFAPPRRDFIAKGWMGNASDYCDPRGDPA